MLISVIAWETVPSNANLTTVAPEQNKIADPIVQKILRVENKATWVQTTLDRPLFNVKRRPILVLPPASEVVPLPRLTGLLTGSFGYRAILLNSEGQSVTLDSGGVSGKWTVAAISRESVTIVGPSGEHTIWIFRRTEMERAPFVDATSTIKEKNRPADTFVRTRSVR